MEGITRLSLNEMTPVKMYKIFGLQKAMTLNSLETWLSNLPDVDKEEAIIAKKYQTLLLGNIDAWNEQELSLNFIGPIFGMIGFSVINKINWFAQRNIVAQINEYELSGKPDGLIASGYYEPEKPFFSFHEFKKEQESKGDPIGQNLAAMLVGQAQNEDNLPIYGCYVVGRNWFFMTLEDKNYAISKAYSADDEDIFEIVKILKALRSILFKRLNITEKI
ncbi:MAG: hypothetical protein AAGG68_09335 [Bacteroidota bacterium]